MTVPKVFVNPDHGPTAPLRNVQLFMQLMDKMTTRASHLPGMGVFYGPSGYGKTSASVYSANRQGAYYIECAQSWNASTLVDSIYFELTGGAMKGTVATKMSAIKAILASDVRPLIVDEADFLIKRAMIDLVREIADHSSVPVLLIGEEQLPAKLAQFERAHNRVLEFQAAEPCDMADTKSLAQLYVPQLVIDDQLLRHVLEASDGVTRRICVNLERVREFAATSNLKDMTMQIWGERVLHTGSPRPRTRRTVRAAA